MGTHRTAHGARWATLAVAVAVLAGCTGGPDEEGSDGPTYEWPTATQLGYDDDGSPGSHGDVVVHEPDVVSHADSASVVELDTTETDGDETVVTLSSDILFAYGKAELTDSATTKIGELVADVPDGATVKVYGHTDSTGSAQLNQDLSERRAKAVARAIGGARPELELDVEGFGETQLKVDEGGDDIAEDRAANRRVEIRYEG